MPNLIAYYRVSTKGQGESGLGLEAQQAAVEAHAKGAGARILASHTEVESGKDDLDRPQLQAAMLHAKRSKATLVIAKLDRLSRDPDFLGALMKAGIDFTACDMPHANKLTIRIMAAVAEQEREAISARTKAALEAYRKRGGKLGTHREGHWDGLCVCKKCHGKEPAKSACEACGGSGTASTSRVEARLNGAKNAYAKGLAVRQENARKAHAELCPILLALRKQGLTLQGIADKLNGDGWKTRTGKDWKEVYVHRFLKQCESTKQTKGAKS